MSDHPLQRGHDLAHTVLQDVDDCPPHGIERPSPLRMALGNLSNLVEVMKLREAGDDVPQFAKYTMPELAKHLAHYAVKVMAETGPA